MKNFLKSTAITMSLIAASTIAGGAAAQETKASATFVENVGASERMNFSGKLRMLSQRIPAAACYYHADIEPDASSALLRAAVEEFVLIENGLEFGEDSLGIIGPETDRRVLAGIHKLHELWDPKLELINSFLEDNSEADEDVLGIAYASHDVLDVAKRLVSAIVGEYADPTAVLQADAFVIDIAGRQRMLAQRISKNACLIMTGLESDMAVPEMQGAREVYEASMHALRNGMPEAGVRATDNEVILAGLDEIIAIWTDVQPILDQVESGAAVSPEDQAMIFHAMNSLTGKMNTLVGIYTEDAKLDL